MATISTLGTQVRLPDGREGTVVFNSLVGVGVKWGLFDPDPADFKGTHGNTFDQEPPYDGWPWEPDALLRDPYPDCERLGMECVGEEYEVLRLGLGEVSGD